MKLTITRNNMEDMLNLTEGVVYSTKVTMLTQVAPFGHVETKEAFAVRKGNKLSSVTNEGAIDLIDFDTYNNGYHHAFQTAIVNLW